MRTPGLLAERFDPAVLGMLQGLDLKARYVVEGFLSGLHKSPFHGYSSEFSEYRDYHPGDDLRHLDWRVYARCNRLCVKRFTAETNTRCYLVVDSSRSMSYRGGAAWGSKLDCVRILAAALSWLLLQQDDSVGLLTRSADSGMTEYLRPSQRPDQLTAILRQLDRLRPSGQEVLGRLLAETARLVHRRSMILVFSDLLEPVDAIARPLRELTFQGNDCLLVHCLDRDEIEFPFQESAVFEDLETGVRRMVSAENRAAYLARFQAFMAAHESLLEDLAIPRMNMQTSDDPGRTLTRFLSERALRT